MADQASRHTLAFTERHEHCPIPFYHDTCWEYKRAEASTLRVESTHDATIATQYELYDVITLNNWINAYTQGNSKLAYIYERRFRPEFQPAFKAWLATDPFTNPKAPPGPLSMPQYKLSLQEQANQLDAKSVQIFAEGQNARDQGDAYVRIAVLLATVLFLTAITENFEWNTIRAVNRA